MTNRNCLEGIRCPKCQHEDDFHVEAIVRVRVQDSGTCCDSADHYWDDESDCLCGNRQCDHKGPWQTFQIANQSAKGGVS